MGTIIVNALKSGVCEALAVKQGGQSGWSQLVLEDSGCRGSQRRNSGERTLLRIRRIWDTLGGFLTKKQYDFTNILEKICF